MSHQDHQTIRRIQGANRIKTIGDALSSAVVSELAATAPESLDMASIPIAGVVPIVMLPNG